jgi:hypothetical protein
MQIFGKIGKIQRLVAHHHGREGFHKNDRFGWDWIVEFFGVVGIIAADAKYLHVQERLKSR